MTDPGIPDPRSSGEKGWTPPAGDGGQVVALDSRRRTGGGVDVSFEVPLDEPEDTEDTDTAGPIVPVLVDLPAVDAARRPIIPIGLRAEALRGTAEKVAGRLAHQAAFHAVRMPWYTVKTFWWGGVGAFKLVGRHLAWWWVAEQEPLRQAAASADDAATWLKLHRDARDTRRWRGIVLAVEAAASAVGAGVLLALAPPPLLAAAAIGVWAALARVGRPKDKKIVGRATVAPRFRKLTSDIVLRAYYAAKLGDPNKPEQQVGFGSTMARDTSGTGSQVVIDLPYGKGFDDAVRAKGAIASGLDVSINQVFLTPDPSSHRRHVLFVADRDPLAIPAGRTPLLDCKPRDIWKAAPFGLDERGRKVTILLMWISVLIGAQPRKGKTFSARLLALYGAADPWVKLFVVDGKNSPDWRKFALVAEAMIYGTHPGLDGDPVEQLLTTLRRIKAHIQKVNEILSRLPVSECPEGKLTPELARDPRYPELRVWMLVMEEFQVYYELDDKDASGEIASLLSFIMAVGPSSGVIIVSSSQKPSGIGSGQNIAQLFTRYRDNHTARFALKCGNRIVSEAVLGGDAYAEGFDASSLPSGKAYRGVGYLYGLTDDTPTTRTYLADHLDAEKILLAARKHRQALGLLSGMAAGETVARDVRDVLADVRGIFSAGEPGLHWQEIAGRLAERMPEHYADITADTISAQLRALNVPSVDVKRSGKALKGAKADAVKTAIARRSTG